MRRRALFFGLSLASSISAGFAPERFDVDVAGRRAVDWYRHAGDPAWGDPETDFVDRFSVAKPVDGDCAGRPLLVVLHWRGAGWPERGVDMQTRLADEKDRVFSAPDDFYVLMLDDIRDYHVLWNRRHAQYWWGATAAYAGPSVDDVARLRGRVTPCEKRVMASVEWTIDRYGIDRNRVYLCGNSMGGQAAYAMGLAHGEVFAAVNANVPATVWFAAARLGFVNDDGTDIRDWDASGFAEPPVCVEWSAVDDVWSRDREVIVRNLVKRKWPHLVLWGDYGHCGSVSKARLKNDLVQKFDWLSIRRDAAYPVFTHASCDDRLPWPFKTWKPHTCWFSGWKGDIDRAEMAIAEGTSPVGQINGFFRWRNIRDDGERLEMELRIAPPEELETRHFAPPEAALADVTVRRVQSPVLAAAPRVRWSFGPASGIAVRDAHGALTIPNLGITRAPRNLVLSLP